MNINEKEPKNNTQIIRRIKKNKSSNYVLSFKEEARDSYNNETKILDNSINKENKISKINKEFIRRRKSKRFHTIKKTNNIFVKEINKNDKIEDELSLFLLLKSNIENTYYINKVFREINILNIIKVIIKKEEKDDNDKFILVTFLKTLSHVIDNISLSKYHIESLNSLLINISVNLKYLEIENNIFLFRIDDIGKEFYIILTGEVFVLLPKYFQVEMTESEYLSYLIFLIKYNEKHLFNNSFKKNRKVFPMAENFVKEKAKKYLELPNSKIPFELYLSYLSGEKRIPIHEKIKASEHNKKEVTICGYFKITELREGNCFGEVAFKNENSLRTASIFTNTSCSFAYLDVENYNSTLRAIQQKAKLENIEFLLSIGIFNGINIEYFEKKYWGLFCSRVITKGEEIFSNGDDFKDEIIIIKNGEFSLESKLNVNKFNDIINYLKLKTTKYKKDDGNDIFNIDKYKEKQNFSLMDEKEDSNKNEFNKKNHNRFDILYESMLKDNKIDINIGFLSNGEVLGLENMVYEGKYFCTAKCISEKCEFFSLQKKYFDNIVFKYSFIQKNMHKFVLLKKDFMYKSFLKTKEQIIKNIKINLYNVYKNSEKSKNIISNNLKILSNTSFNLLQKNIIDKFSFRIKKAKLNNQVPPNNNNSISNNSLKIKNDFSFDDLRIIEKRKIKEKGGKKEIDKTDSSLLIYPNQNKYFEEKKKIKFLSPQNSIKYPKIISNNNNNFYNNVVFGYKNMNITLNKNKIKKLKLKNYLSLISSKVNANSYKLNIKDLLKTQNSSIINNYDCLIYDSMNSDRDESKSYLYQRKNEISPIKGSYKYNMKMKRYKSQFITGNNNEYFNKKTSIMYILKPHYKFTKKIYSNKSFINKPKKLGKLKLNIFKECNNSNNNKNS